MEECFSKLVFYPMALPFSEQLMNEGERVGAGGGGERERREILCGRFLRTRPEGVITSAHIPSAGHTNFYRSWKV